MNFELETWEIPPGAEVDKASVSIEFGPVEWQDQIALVSARWANIPKYRTGAFVRFHGNNEGKNPNYVITRGSKISVFETTNSKYLGRIARQAIAGQEFQLRRLFCLEGEFCLMSATENFWKRRSSKNGVDSSFAVPDEIKFKSSKLVFNWLRQQWRQPDSEVRVSWDWNQKNLQEQQQYFAQTVLRWRELSEVINAIATANQLPLGQNWVPANGDCSLYSPELSARLTQWAALLKTHFFLYELLSPSEFRCARDSFQFAAEHISVRGAEFSAHQQLEAKLHLRDWLQRNAPGHLHLVQ